MTTTITDQASSDHRLYRALRRDGWKPPYAVRFIRDDRALAEAEADDLITFERRWDDCYEPFDVDDEGTEAEREGLASGRLEVWGIIATAPARAMCRLCRTPADVREASLWGVVVDLSPDGQRYLRDVEIELARELDVIG